jgi:CHAT domain-containing protein
VWKPLEPHLAGVETVLIAPDSALNRLPFAALPGRQPGSIAIGYVTSGRDLIDIFGGSPGRQGHGLLAVGGIDYQADVLAKRPGTAPSAVEVKNDPVRLGSADLPAAALASSSATGVRKMAERAPPALLEDRDRGRISFLPGTETEARQCRDLFAQAYPGEPATLLTGLEPSESRVKQEFGKGYRYIHLATHGFFESPRRVAALRSSTGHGQPQGLRQQEDQTLAL